MKEKLRILMQKENLTASKLAEMLGTKPAGISHILNGRNNPSYELVCRIINRFPQINPYWLLGDSDKMYNEAGIAQPSGTTSSGASTNQNNLFDVEPIPETAQSADVTSGEEHTTSTQALPIAGMHHSSSDIERVIITYADGSFESFIPRK